MIEISISKILQILQLSEREWMLLFNNNLFCMGYLRIELVANFFFFLSIKNKITFILIVLLLAKQQSRPSKKKF